MNKYITLVIFSYLTLFNHAQNIGFYEMYSNHFDVDKYFNEPAAHRKFDKDGVITQNNQYHALTISVYGTMCIDKFLKTGDSVYYNYAINQMKYFKDSSRLLFFDNDSAVGLPYHMIYHGLKPPWFSGLAQGMAASFLFRHFQLTGEKYSLELGQKVIRQLLKDEKNGGAMSKTYEGYPWIEEYPNYKGSKGVLNGFVNGLIGLKEYLEFYPNDSVALKIHDECYDALFSTLEAYDKPNWTSYNRNGSSIRNSYIRLQIQQFDQLYNIYKDERFRTQMKIWGMFAYNKFDKEWLFYKDPNYLFSVKMDKNDSCWSFSGANKFDNSLMDVQINKINKKVFQIDLAKHECYYIELPKWLTQKNIKKVIINDKVIDDVSFTNNVLRIESKEDIYQVKIRIKRKVKNKDIQLFCKVYNYKKYLLPMFAFVQFEEKKQLQKGKAYTINFDSENTINARVYYRFSNTIKGLRNVKFSLEKSFERSIYNFLPPEDGFYEFFLSYDILLPESKVNFFRIE